MYTPNEYLAKSDLTHDTAASVSGGTTAPAFFVIAGASLCAMPPLICSGGKCVHLPIHSETTVRTIDIVVS